MIVALTGGTGFVGGHTIGRLLEAGHKVRALTRKFRPEREDVVWVEGSLSDETSLARLCDGAEAVIHVAGIVNAPDAAGFDTGNRVGTVAVLHAAEAAGIARFVHISSLAAREPQLSFYGASKRAAEDAVITSTRDWRIARPTAIYGPGDTELLDMFRMADRGFAALPPGLASWIHVDDFARLIVALVTTPDKLCLYEADDGTPHGWSHRDFAAALGIAVGRKVRALPIPTPLLKPAAWFDGLLRGGNAKLTPDRARYIAHPDWSVDPAKRPPPALWTPAIATTDGLTETVAWYRANGLLAPKSK